MGKIAKNVILVLIGFLILSWAIAYFRTGTKVEDVSISQIVSDISEQRVESIEVLNDKVEWKLKSSDVKKSATLGNEGFTDFLKNNGVDPEKIAEANISFKGVSATSGILNSILPLLIPVILISLFLYFLMRQIQGSNNRAMSFGQTNARISDERNNTVRFADVAGAAEAKEELKEVVEFLKFPQKFLAVGAKIPKGVLLLGAPGVGKTLLARAVAGEANVPFFHISGSEFVEMFVGVGASRVRDLFKKAKKNAPCIVFVDEIDAVGRQRGTGLGGGHDEREQTLNQILVEMDGFETDTNVIVVAATNRPDVLDPALLRPGRFDRQVVLDLPDLRDREAILEVHSKNKPLAKDINLKVIAERTPGFSGADLANLLNEAAILTARHDKTEITNKFVREAIEKVILGPERKSHILSDKEKKVTAYHEGGHALVGTVLAYSDPVHKVSIISRGRAAGYTMKLPLEDKHMHTKSSFLDEIAALLGGYAAEKMVFNELTTGPSNDLKVATSMARRLVTMYGMSDALGPVVFGENQEAVFLGRELGEHRNYSEDVAKRIDEEVGRILKEGFERAKEVLVKHRDYLDKIADLLIKQETIEREEFRELVKDVTPKEKKQEIEFGSVSTESVSVA